MFYFFIFDIDTLVVVYQNLHYRNREDDNDKMWVFSRNLELIKRFRGNFIHVWSGEHFFRCIGNKTKVSVVSRLNVPNNFYYKLPYLLVYSCFLTFVMWHKKKKPSPRNVKLSIYETVEEQSLYFVSIQIYPSCYFIERSTVLILNSYLPSTLRIVDSVIKCHKHPKKLIK